MHVSVDVLQQVIYVFIQGPIYVSLAFASPYAFLSLSLSLSLGFSLSTFLPSEIGKAYHRFLLLYVISNAVRRCQ